MNTATQLKALIRNLAEAKNINPQSVMANYMFERLLERIAKSKYQSNFILKGGLLIASMVGLDERATMDMDATIKGYPLTAEKLREILDDVIAIPVEDNIAFLIKGVAPIREDSEYGGMRASLEARFDKMKVPLKIDVTTGDSITPRAIQYQYPLMFEERKLDILAYNLETVLAEKMETILTRSTANTRMRDFYDIYILTKFHSERIDFALFGKALRATVENRASMPALESAENTLESILGSTEMKQLWEDYGTNYPYACDIIWDEAFRSVKDLFLKVR
jgi:predicted nucleotidyltransferase component of viral defense system